MTTVRKIAINQKGDGGETPVSGDNSLNGKEEGPDYYGAAQKIKLMTPPPQAGVGSFRSCTRIVETPQNAIRVMQSMMKVLPPDAPQDIQVVACTTAEISPSWVTENPQVVFVSVNFIPVDAEDARWAYYLGHEIGHLLAKRQVSPVTGPYAQEGLADLVAFQLAQRAGYRVPTFGEICTWSPSMSPARARVLQDVRTYFDLSDKMER